MVGDDRCEDVRVALLDARAGHPLTRTHVIVASTIAAITLRRALAADSGLANVRFGSIGQLAEQLAARHLALDPSGPRSLVTPALRREALRRALTNCSTSPVTAMAGDRAGLRLLERLVGELDRADVDPDERPPGLSSRGVDVLDLYAAYRRHLGPAVTPPQLVRAAAAAIRCGTDVAVQVVLVDDRAVTDAEQELLNELAAVGRLHRPTHDGAPTSADVHLTVAPDAEEEVRTAVRRVVDHLERHPLRPERLGIAYSSEVPYARMLAEQLTAAGLPHHVAVRRHLDETLAGRTLLSTLQLHRRGYPRADTLTWLSAAPMRTADGKPVPSWRWEQISRGAGVSRGLDTWRLRLERWARKQAARDVIDEAARDARDRRLADASSLGDTVEAIAALAEAALTAATWTDVSNSLLALLRQCLGDPTDVDGWSWSTSADLDAVVEREQQAHADVARALTDLAELDRTSAPPTPDSVAEVVADELRASVPGTTTLGRGILVGPIADFTGADLDLLVVVGLTEDAAPARQREHPVLWDADRVLLSPHLATVATRRADARHAWLAALGAARHMHLSTARANTRSQRRQFPSPWFLDEAERLAGRRVSMEDVTALTADWLTTSDSSTDALLRTEAFASPHELDVAIAVRGGVDVLASHDHRLRRGLLAARTRARGTFGEWTGGVGALPAVLRAEIDQRHSASALQEWATCPTRHLFRYVLGVRDVEDVGARDGADPRERGTLVHAVLEEFLSRHLGEPGRPGRDPGEAWSGADLDDLLRIFEDRVSGFVADGLAGRHAVVWSVERARLRRALTAALHADSESRRRHDAWPIALEMPFGRDGQPDLEVHLPTQGPVSFAGSVDRVDATADGGLVILDYKAGRAAKYPKLLPERGSGEAAPDIVDRGRMLQLPLYALASRTRFGSAETPVEGYFSLVERRGIEVGAEIDDAAVERLTHALEVSVSGIRSGVYPANPGQLEDSRGWESCRHCAFDRVCPDTRGEQWRAAREDPAVSEYRRLASTEEEEV